MAEIGPAEGSRKGISRRLVIAGALATTAAVLLRRFSKDRQETVSQLAERIEGLTGGQRVSLENTFLTPLGEQEISYPAPHPHNPEQLVESTIRGNLYQASDSSEPGGKTIYAAQFLDRGPQPPLEQGQRYDIKGRISSGAITTPEGKKNINFLAIDSVKPRGLASREGSSS